MRYGEAGQSHLLPFLGAAALFAALTITAHSVVLGLAAIIAGPVPAAQTALSLSRKAVSGAAQEEAASVAEAAPETHRGLPPLSPKPPPRQAASKAILWSFWGTTPGPKARAQ